MTNSNSPTELLVHEPTQVHEGLAREPMAIRHPSGALFVAAYGSQTPSESHPRQTPRLWKSSDGKNWTRVDVGSPEDGAIGNSDVDLTLGFDGTIYFASMGFSRETFRGTHIAIGASRDVGETWHWSLLSETDLDDRPWVVVTPDGRAHAVWNDGNGVSYARTEDGAFPPVWQEQPRIHPAGGSSHFAAGPNGELAVRISPMSASANRYDEGVDLIKVSTDGGDTWLERPLPGAPVWPTKPQEFNVEQRWVEPLAWDQSGALFHLWAEGPVLYLARSRDLGASWLRWQVAEHAEKMFFPYLVSREGAEGEVAATWFEGGGDELAARFAVFRFQADSEAEQEPESFLSEPTALDLYGRVPSADGAFTHVRSTGGEYFPILFLDDGKLAAVTTLQPIEGEPGFTWWPLELQ